MPHDLWLVGAGSMGTEYAKVLKALDVQFITIGRGAKRAAIFRDIAEGPVVPGGIEAYICSKPKIPQYAIVSVGVEALKSVTLQLIAYGVPNILVEKPAGLNRIEINEVQQAAARANATVFVAYNRRFYSSAQKGKDLIRLDGGVTSFNFEFTEWSHVIEKLEKESIVKKNWLLANSTHVIDMAFFMAGSPKQIFCFTGGGLHWHPSASIFAGAGITEQGALFSYQANWGAPGRWGVEILTNHHRFFFRPLEKLQLQKQGSLVIESCEIDDRLDIAFKPGLYLQVKNLIRNRTDEFCTIQDQCERAIWYERIAGY